MSKTCRKAEYCSKRMRRKSRRRRSGMINGRRGATAAA